MGGSCLIRDFHYSRIKVCPVTRVHGTKHYLKHPLPSSRIVACNVMYVNDGANHKVDIEQARWLPWKADVRVRRLSNRVSELFFSRHLMQACYQR